MRKEEVPRFDPRSPDNILRLAALMQNSAISKTSLGERGGYLFPLSLHEVRKLKEEADFGPTSLIFTQKTEEATLQVWQTSRPGCFFQIISPSSPSGEPATFALLIGGDPEKQTLSEEEVTKFSRFGPR